MVMTKKRLTAKIDAVLEKYQFYGNGLLWNRDYSDYVDVIDLQISKFRDMFTINVGVADKFVIHACWGLNGAEMVGDPSCTVRARLGELLYGRDVWWSLSDSEAIEEVLSAIQDVAMPFLQINHNIDHMIQSLEKDLAIRRYLPEAIYLALLYYRKGERDRCREMFKSLKLNDAWSKKASDILDALS